MKEKLHSLPRSSKQWWGINRQLMRRRAQATSIPVLKEGDRWLTDAKDKADAFARVFVSKSNLPDEFVDAPFFGAAPSDGIHFLPLRTRNAFNLFRKLDTNQNVKRAVNRQPGFRSGASYRRPSLRGRLL